MADLLQGAPLPSTITTEQQQTQAPEFYTNYLQDVANLGQNAVTQGGVAGFGPLQQQAFQMAPNAAFSGAQTAGSGADFLTLAGSTAAPQLAQNYMNPYTRNVVDEMARLQQQNLQRNVLPTIAGAGVGTGSFGSRRQQQALGQSLTDMQANLLGQQYGALSSGFKDAVSAAQTDLNRQLQAGQGMGNIANIQQTIGQGGLKTLSDLGSQQQALGQAQLNYPMLAAQNYAKLLQGYTIPTGTTKQTTAPGTQGQFSISPLQQIGTLLGALQGVSGGSTGTTGTTGGGNLVNSILGLPSTAVNTIKDLLGTFGISFADGGQVNGYADGGTIQPTDMQVMPGSYDPTLEAQKQDYVYPETSITDIQPGGEYYTMGENPIAYAGGTPNFNEATGSYVNQPTKGDNPLPWERSMSEAISHVPTQIRDRIHQVRRESEQRRQLGFNPWNRPGQPTPFPAQGTTPTGQGGYNPKPSQSNLNILDAKGNVIGVRDVLPTQRPVTPTQPTGGLPTTVTTQDKFVPPTQPDYSKYNLPADVVAALNNSWQNYAKMGYGATDMGYMGYDPVTGTIKGMGGMMSPDMRNAPGISIADYQAQLAQQAKQKAAFDAAVKLAYPNGAPEAMSMQDIMPYLPQDFFPQLPMKPGTGLGSIGTTTPNKPVTPTRKQDKEQNIVSKKDTDKKLKNKRI